MDVLTLQSAKRYADGRTRHQGPASIMAMGDSITRNGNTDPIGAVDYIIGGQSYLWWACMLANGGLVYRGVAATGGFTSAQIISTHLPTVLAAKPSYCVVNAGTNDNGTLTQAQTIANLKFIYDSLLAAGITPIATTMLPKQTVIGSNAKILQQISVWITRYALTRNFPCVDWNVLFSSPTDGNWVGYNGAGGTYQVDSTHPNAAGAKLMGQALWNQIKAWIPPVTLYLPTANPNGASAFVPTQTNALFLTDTNSDGVADGMTLAGVGATGTLTAMSASEGVGNWQNITSAGAAGAQLTANNGVITAGNKYLVGLRIKTAGIKSGAAQWNVRFTDSNTVDIFAIRNITEDVTLGAIWHEFTMPPGVPASGRIIGSVAGGAGTLSIGQVMIYDLTATGILP
jgi:lysophospholipase L1-like esterase